MSRLQSTLLGVIGIALVGLFLFLVLDHFDRGAGPKEPPGVVFATIDVTCGGDKGKTFTISTGNKKGECRAIADGKLDVETGKCDDGKGNSALVACRANGGAGTCSNTQGSGSCVEKK